MRHTDRLQVRCVAAVMTLVLAASLAVAADEPVDIGSRRELFVDSVLIDRLENARLAIHAPQPQEIVMRFDRPWEGPYSNYGTVVRDGDMLRLYYRGMAEPKHTLDVEVTCIAESRDGVAWTRPTLGLFDVHGTKDNNVCLARHRGCHNLAPFLDANPAAPADQRYKALGGTGEPGLIAFASPDGIHWRELRAEPVITKGAFDSQNNAFWSATERQYVCHFRVFRDGVRWIARTTSPDFVHWSDPVDLELDGKPRQELYTNQMEPYVRAPHLCLGVPTRFMPGRRVVTADEAGRIGTPKAFNYASDCADIVFTSARGGTDFKRTFLEAFIRPGPDLRNWTSRANYAARGILQTGEQELSLYVFHHVGYPDIHLRRYTLRPDGFVSVSAPFTGGRLITKPLVFSGRRLLVNHATSAAGGMRVGIRDADGRPLPGFTLDECSEIVGDRLEHAVQWKSGGDMGPMAGKPVRLEFELRDADLFAIQFVGE